MSKISTFFSDESQMSTAYDAASVEGRIYSWWENNGLFAPQNKGNDPFTIIMPPPNLTGELHTGHALTATIEDSLTRWHRMLQHDTLWLPGVDHAAIAVNAIIERQLRADGLSRHDIGREAFLERTWEFVNESRSRISSQHKRLGASADWEREAFTMDANRELSVRTTFKNLYEDGLIFRAERLINWCVGCHSAISDIEVEYEDEDTSFWHIRYEIVDTSDAIIIATTRPETIPADIAVAVNSKDERYSHLIGKLCRVPTTDRVVPIIADDAVSIESGSGALKVTPAHDQVDFEIGERHGLEIINILEKDGTLNQRAGAYNGLSLLEARSQIVQDMANLGLVERIDPYNHSVGHCQRCATVIEPLLSEQWWVDAKTLSGPAIDAVKEKKINFVPPRFERTYLHWMENIRDWCISRQIWWGHRIPVWYCDECDYLTVAITDPEECDSCGCKDIRQDEDTLDTWFSSGLWPHSTLGWPNETNGEWGADLDRFYPTQVMETGYDIIFFWVARMIMLSLYNMDGRVPFDTVYLHGLVRAADGRKMSKSLSNSVDPLETIDQYGCDGLRYALLSGTSPGNDQRLTEDRLESGRNFSNKLWNAGRFVISLREEYADQVPGEIVEHSLEDRWIQSRLTHLVQEVQRLMDSYELSEAIRQIRDFFWDDFADWYLELAKIQIRSGNYSPITILTEVLDTVLRLLHPFMPFITEEIWQRLEKSKHESTQQKALIVEHYPSSKDSDGQRDLTAEEMFTNIQDFIRTIRNIRAEKKVDAARDIEGYIASESTFDDLVGLSSAITALAKVNPLHIVHSASEAPVEQVASGITGAGTVILPLGGLFDLAEERSRLEKEKASLEEEIARQNLKLQNPQFVSKAPAEIVEKEHNKLESAKSQIEAVDQRLSEL